MKHQTVRIVFAWAVLCCTTVLAADEAGADRRRYMINKTDKATPHAGHKGGWNRWAVELDGRHQERDIVYKETDQIKEWEINHLALSVAYDAAGWLTARASAGGADPDIQETEIGNCLVWGGGLDIRILNYQLPVEREPYYFRLNSRAQYHSAESGDSQDTAAWEEWFADITAGITRHPLEDLGYSLQEVGVYMGLALSDISGEVDLAGVPTDIEEDGGVGMVAGIHFTFSDFIGLRLEWQYFDLSSFDGKVTIRF